MTDEPESAFIIFNRIGDDNLALDLVSRVVHGGKVSETFYGKQCRLLDTELVANY